MCKVLMACMAVLIMVAAAVGRPALAASSPVGFLPPYLLDAIARNGTAEDRQRLSGHTAKILQKSGTSREELVRVTRD